MTHPELHDGFSAFGSEKAARRRWKGMKKAADKEGSPVRHGDFIAEVYLEPDQGFFVDDPGLNSEHLTVSGDCDKLAGAATRTFRVEG